MTKKQSKRADVIATKPGSGSDTRGCWWVYLLACEHGMTYIGTAADVAHRFARHQSGKGATFTRINKPLSVLGAQPFPDRSSACKAEYALKRQALQSKLEWSKKWPWRGAATG